MGGSGSLQTMRTILRNNKMLLRKVGMFNKKRSFFESRKEYLKASNGEIDFKKISKSELKKLRDKVIKERKSTNLKNWIITLLITIPIVIMVTIISNNFNSERNLRYENAQKTILKEQLKIKNENYLYSINEGDKWIKKQHWHNAIYHYEKAVNEFPERYNSNYRLALAYSYNCKYKNKDCDKGLKLVKRLLKIKPKDTDLIKLNNIMLN